MREVTYKEIYDLIFDCDYSQRIDIGNGEYVKLSEFDAIWGLGLETNNDYEVDLGQLYCKALDNKDYWNCVGSYAELISGKTDLVQLLVDDLNEYIVEQNKKEA